MSYEDKLYVQWVMDGGEKAEAPAPVNTVVSVDDIEGGGNQSNRCCDGDGDNYYYCYW